MNRFCIALASTLVIGSLAPADDQVPQPGLKAASSCTKVISGVGSATPKGVISGLASLPSCLKSAHDLGVVYGSRNLPPTLPSGYRTLGQQGIPVYGGVRGR